MDVQFIEMSDPIARTIFEIYAAMHLGTETYNYDTGESSRFVWLRDAQIMEH